MFLAAAYLIGTGILYAQEPGPAPEGIPAGVSAMPEAQVVLVPESEIILGEALPETPESGGRQIFVIIRMVLVLALAAAAVYGVVYFLRRSARPQTQRNPHLKILTSAHLGSNRYVYVVSVGVKAWLIGAGEGGVNLISEVEDQEAVDAMLLDESRAAAEAGASRFADFKALLRRLGGGGGPPGTISRNGFSTETLRKQRERLKGL